MLPYPGAFYGFNNIFIEIPTVVHTEQDFQIIRFDLSYDCFDRFCSAVCGVRVAAAHKASNIGLQFITEGKLEIVTVVPRPFWIVSFRVALFE